MSVFSELLARQALDRSTPLEAAAPDNVRSRTAFGVAITFMILSTVAVILRIAGRRIRRAKLSWDDYTIFAALFCVYVMCISVMLEVLYGGAGRHAQDVDPRRIANLLKILVVLQIFFGLSNGLVKCSICLLYIRIFSTRPFRIAAWGVLAVCAAWGLMVVLTAFLLCRPFAYNWDHTIPGHCADLKATFVSVGALDILTDLLILCLPLKTLWHLQMRTASKIALTGVFGLGFFTIVISCFRIYTLLDLDFQDITYTNAYPFMWSCMEPATGVIIACAPVAKAVFGRLFENRSQHSSRQTGSKGNSRTTGSSWARVGSAGPAEDGEQYHRGYVSDTKPRVEISPATSSAEDEWVLKHARSDEELWIPLAKNPVVSNAPPRL